MTGPTWGRWLRRRKQELKARWVARRLTEPPRPTAQAIDPLG